MIKSIDITKRKIGVNFNGQAAEVLLWAPHANKVQLKINDLATLLDLNAQDYGYWCLETELIEVGMDYWFVLTDANGKIKHLPDPASLSQPNGVHESSNAIDLKDFTWADHDWKGISIEKLIIYELHTGTFSAEGTFLGIEQKLDYLLDLGISAIEIMPVGQFPGNRNWGYDGIFPFAVQSSYGGMLGLQNLVNICHQKGLSVILDVVYNHLGPEGNYFNFFAPYFTSKYQIPWGNAINFDDAYCDGVRHFFIENVLMWFRDFHIDGLRLDAVHAIKDLSATHFLAEVRKHVNELSQITGRNYHLIVELDLNDNKFINPIEKEGFGMDAQWIDEFHHALRVAAGQKQTAYYADFNGVEHLAKAYKDAYVYDGIYSDQRKRTFGKPATGNSGKQFIVFSQNHDQVGNRMLGERTSVLHSFEMQKLLLGTVLISPFLPMLFMGEEWGETNPFLYFVSHSDKGLIAAVRKGRKDEFKEFYAEGEAPDPQDEATFNRSKLQWNLLSKAKHQQLLAYYKTFISLRKSNKVLSNLNKEQLETTAFPDQNILIIKRWQDDEEIICFLNFSQQRQQTKVETNQNYLVKILDSASVQWGGNKDAKEIIKSNEVLTIEPESIIVYANTK